MQEIMFRQYDTFLESFKMQYNSFLDDSPGGGKSGVSEKPSYL